MNSNTFNGFSKAPVQIIVAVAFIAAIVLAGPKASSQAQVLISLSGSDRVFQGEVIEDMVVLDAVIAAIRAGNLPLETSIDPVRDITIIKQDGKVEDISVSVNAKRVDALKIHHIPVFPDDIVTVKIL